MAHLRVYYTEPRDGDDDSDAVTYMEASFHYDTPAEAMAAAADYAGSTEGVVVTLGEKTIVAVF